MNFKKNVFLFLILLGLILLTTIITNYIVDPFQILHRTEEKFINNPRIQNAGLINNYLNSNDGFDSLIIGNSLSMGFRAKETANIMDWKKTMKLSAAGSLPYTQRVTLDYALRHKGVKHVLWILPIVNYKLSTNALGQFEKNFSNFLYLYDDNHWNEINYLLNISTLKKSISIIFGRKLKRKNMDNQNLGYIRNSTWDRWSSEENIAKLYSIYKKAFEKIYTYKNSIDTSIYQKSTSIDDNLVSIIQSHPETEFTLIIPPYSYFLTQQIYMEQLAGIKLFLEKTATLTNVTIYGFANEDFIKNQYYYRDRRHYSAEISAYILHLIKEGRIPLTLDNLDQYQKEILNNLNSYKTIYSKNTHIYSNYIETIQKKDMINFVLHSKYKNIKVAFWLYRNKTLICKNDFSQKLTYLINKKMYKKGKYRLKYFIIDGEIEKVTKSTYKETGYSEYVLID